MKTLKPHQLAADIFRRNYSRTVAILTRHFGLDQVEVAEDIVQDTLIEAMEKWKIHSIPDNPEGWIMEVAKKKTIDLLRRKHTFEHKVAPRIIHDITYDEQTISDNTLRMIFACCHPSLPNESQVALALKTLCGLSVPEIARALLTTEENINKRLYRAKKKFRDDLISFEIPADDELDIRLAGVYRTLYLLFNEGYYAPHHREVLRIDLCYEATRLLYEILQTWYNSHEGNGLMALMLLSLARFESRLDENDSLICLQDQNRKLWDQKLISEGMEYLIKSTEPGKTNKYQLQAGIAAEHSVAANFEETNWKSIYRQYCILETLEPSFLVKMNKCIAYFYAKDKLEAIHELQSLRKLQDFFECASYFLTLGTLYLYTEQKEKSKPHLEKALAISSSNKEKKMVQRRIDFLKSV